MSRTDAELHDRVTGLLAPITRTRYTYVGAKRGSTLVNPSGLDLHDGRVDAVALDEYGRAEPYLGLMVHPQVLQHGPRMAGGPTSTTFEFSLTVAAGSPAGARWGLDKVRPLLRRVRLVPEASLLRPVLDQSDLLEDPDASPPRWFSPLRFRSTVF